VAFWQKRLGEDLARAGWSVGGSYTYTAGVQPSKTKTPKVTEPSRKGGTQSFQEFEEDIKNSQRTVTVEAYEMKPRGASFLGHAIYTLYIPSEGSKERSQYQLVQIDNELPIGPIGGTVTADLNAFEATAKGTSYPFSGTNIDASGKGDYNIGIKANYTPSTAWALSNILGFTSNPVTFVSTQTFNVTETYSRGTLISINFNPLGTPATHNRITNETLFFKITIK
jgi:hypothetical protein